MMYSSNDPDTSTRLEVVVIYDDSDKEAAVLAALGFDICFDNRIEGWSSRAQARAGWPHPNNGHHVRPWRMDRLLGPRNVKPGYHHETR